MYRLHNENNELKIFLNSLKHLSQTNYYTLKYLLKNYTSRSSNLQFILVCNMKDIIPVCAERVLREEQSEQV